MVPNDREAQICGLESIVEFHSIHFLVEEATALFTPWGSYAGLHRMAILVKTY